MSLIALAASASRLLPVGGAVLAPVMIAAAFAWLSATLRSAGAAHQQAATLAQVVEAQRLRAERLSDSHVALRRAEAQARSEATRARAEAADARRRIDAAPPTETAQCPIDCLLPLP